MRVYTKTGDQGQTGLVGSERVSKTDPRIQSVGELDELNAVIGFVRSMGPTPAVEFILEKAQCYLFDIGAEIASLTEKGSSYQALEAQPAIDLEASIDQLTDELSPLKGFILPGGTKTASSIHWARTVCRRAERTIFALNEDYSIREEVLQYLNRLSDWLFTAARYENFVSGELDVLWQSSKK